MQDLQNIFCTAQNVFGNGTTVASTDWIPLGAAVDFAAGKPVMVEVVVTTTFAGGTSGRFQLTAVDSAGANAVVLDTTDAIPIASLTAGTRLQLRMSPKMALPSSTLTCLRLQNVNVGNNTAGAISAFLCLDNGSENPAKAYPTGW